MNEKKLFEKLDKMTKLIAALAIKDKGLKEQVKLLSSAGLKPSEIADMLGKSANLIRVTKFELGKKNG